MTDKIRAKICRRKDPRKSIALESNDDPIFTVVLTEVIEAGQIDHFTS